ALSDAAEVDPHARIMKADAIIRKHLDGGSRYHLRRTPCPTGWPIRKQANVLQGRGNGDVEQACRMPMQVYRCFEDFKRPAMYPDRTRERFCVQACDVAVVVVEAHEPMHFDDSVEGGIDCRVHVARRCIGDRDLYECAEEWSRATDAI